MSAAVLSTAVADGDAGPAAGSSDQLDLLHARILVVDDNEANSELIRQILLDAGYRHVTTTRDAEDVPRRCTQEPPLDLLVLDLHMPGMSGFEVLAALRALLVPPTFLPVLALTADVTSSTRRRALSMGAHDFVTKPVDPAEVLLRVRNLLQAHLLQRDLEARVAERTHELEVARLETLQRLGLAAEYRDDYTNRHTARVGRTAGSIAAALGLDAGVVELIRLAAPLHDMGKVGIPDAVLLSSEPLSEERTAIMRSHVRIGAELLAGSSSPVLDLAAEIARFHHERWDGDGYLEGLSGEAIPLSARITTVADVFDALTHRRPYREAWSVQRSLAEMRRLRARVFDPAVLDAFLAVCPDAPRAR